MAIVSHSPFSGSGGSTGPVNWPSVSVSQILNNLTSLIIGNPESAIIAGAPLPIIGAGWTPQQLIWRTTLAGIGLQAGYIQGDDAIPSYLTGSSSSLPSSHSTWMGPGVEWFV